jgi:hypothetical protein
LDLLAANADVDAAADHDAGGDEGPEQEPHHGPLRGEVHHHKVRDIGVVVAVIGYATNTGQQLMGS